MASGKTIVSIALTGSHGRMEQAIRMAAFESQWVKPIWTLDSGSESGDFDPSQFQADFSARVQNQPVDVVIDFSHPERTLAAASIASKYHIPLLVGTTGFTPEQNRLLIESVKHIPLFLESNMSYGVHVLKSVLNYIHPLLRESYDFEIIESHHSQKKDAPSGTALKLLQAWAEREKQPPEAIWVKDRFSKAESRRPGSVAVHAIRGGSIVGTHTLLFAGAGEVLRFEHEALDRKLFAYGALKAAAWLKHQKPGLYSMDDLITGRKAP